MHDPEHHPKHHSEHDPFHPLYSLASNQKKDKTSI